MSFDEVELPLCVEFGSGGGPAFSTEVPAYRGLAYVVFEDLQLSNFGNRLPNLTFEIVPATFTVNVYQISSRYGRGAKITAVV